MAISERQLHHIEITATPPIVRLERELHERRTAIKHAASQLPLLKTLHDNGFMDDVTFMTERNTITTQMRELGSEQHRTRKTLQPLKRATEKRKSPFTPPQPVTVFEAPQPLQSTRTADLEEKLASTRQMRVEGQISKARYNMVKRKLQKKIVARKLAEKKRG